MKLEKSSVGFTQISNSIINDPRLSYKAKGLYCYLFSKPDGWTFYQSDILNHASDGSTSVRNTLKELEKFGVVERHQARQENGKLGGMVIRLKTTVCTKTVCRKTVHGKTVDGKPHTNNTNTSNTNISNINNNTCSFDNERAFEDFWKAYNKKTGKKSAQKIWKRNKLDSKADKIIQAAQKYSDLFKAKGNQYQKHPSTWLNGEHWEDELSHINTDTEAAYDPVEAYLNSLED